MTSLLFGPTLREAHAQANLVTVEQIEYASPKLDSLMRAFQKLGFRLAPQNPVANEQQRVAVLVSAGPALYLTSTLSTDTGDWQTKALWYYGTHVTSMMLGVASVTELAHRFDSLRIAYDTIGPAIALRGPEPLDLIFIDSNFKLRPRSFVPPDTERAHPTRATWLVLSASEEEKAVIRKVWDALGLRKYHDGCCDYWLIGPPENRVATRFEIPSPETPNLRYEGSWLSIEPGGVVFGY